MADGTPLLFVGLGFLFVVALITVRGGRYVPAHWSEGQRDHESVA